MVLVDRRARLAPDNLCRLEREVGDHILGDRAVEELVKRIILVLWTAWVGLVIHYSWAAIRYSDGRLSSTYKMVPIEDCGSGQLIIGELSSESTVFVIWVLGYTQKGICWFCLSN